MPAVPMRPVLGLLEGLPEATADRRLLPAGPAHLLGHSHWQLIWSHPTRCLIRILYSGSDTLLWEHLSQVALDLQLLWTSVHCDFASDIAATGRDPAGKIQKCPLSWWILKFRD